MIPAHHHVPVNALVDSGCSTRAFCDRALVTRLGIKTSKTPHPRTLILADGKKAGRPVDSYFIAPLVIGNHEEQALFFVTDLSPETPVILGLPWLQRHNPAVDWAQLSLTFDSDYCRTFCCPEWLDNRAPVKRTPPKSFHDLHIPGEPRLRTSRQTED
ncbi:hypothetical protein C8A03DRAFT_20042, partial [Achaetomium macrosporum]